MKKIRKFGLLVFIATFLLISIVLLDANNNNIAYSSNLSSNSNLPEFKSMDEETAKSQDIIFSDKAQDQSCGECHDGFEPFSVELEMSETVAPEEPFQYELIVSNSDTDTPHTVEELVASLTGIGATPKDSYYNEIDDSVRRFQTNSHSFPVDANANKLDVILTGESGFIGRNNIDLRLTSPNGQVWSSTLNGADEEIHLDNDDILKAGVGDYDIEVQFVSGMGPISYTVTIDVSYISTDLVKYGDNLDTGDTYDFYWNLILTSEELNELGSEVSGTVSYEHRGGNTESYRYTIELNPGTTLQKNSKVPISPLLINGRIIGLLSLVVFGAITIFGFIPTTRNIIANRLKLKNPQNVHCLLSLSIILFGLIHATLLIMGPYSWDAEPNLYGVFAILIFGAIAITSFNRQTLISKIGLKQWKRLHLIFIILFALIIIYHSVTFGYHFR